MDYIRWNLKLPSLCQKTLTSETTTPYLRLNQNDKLGIPTYQAEMEPAIFIIHSQVKYHKIRNTRNFKHKPHKLVLHTLITVNFGLEQNTIV